MKGIVSELYTQLQDTLRICGPFASDNQLHDVFIDARIKPWQVHLPESINVEQRVSAVINFLYHRYNYQGENALVLFLHTLADNVDRQDACHNQLIVLADVLEQYLQDNDTDLESLLSRKLRGWFEVLGYQFENHNVHHGRNFEWVISYRISRRQHNRVLVYGVEGEAQMAHFLALREAVARTQAQEGWLVALQRVASSVRQIVNNSENQFLSCYTFDELLDEEADFEGYINWLENEIKAKNIDNRYIPLACTKPEYDLTNNGIVTSSYYDDIELYVDQWLDDSTKVHLSILGEFGTGKTWFCLHYAWRLLQRYLDAKTRGVARPRLPIIITLRDYAKAVSIESLFSEFFFRKHEIPLPGYTAFEHLNRMGKFVLIFDGFDEMAMKIDRQQIINNFWELARAIVPGAKTILTCRTEYLPEAKEGRSLLNAELKASTANLTGESPQFEILHLERFNDAQMRQVFSYYGDSVTVDRVLNHEQLRDLARRPVMTELVIEAMPDIVAGKSVDLARVYLYAVQRKMERDIRAERTFTSLADKLYFLCELSWEMLSTDQMSLNYRLFPDRLQRLFGGIVRQNLDHWHYDMMGQTLLVRNADGNYSLAHRSLLEFFVAYKFAAEMGALSDEFVEIARNQSNIVAGVHKKDYTWQSYFCRDVNEKGEVFSISRLRNFIHTPLNHLVDTFGSQRLSTTILTLMKDMVDEERVWEIVKVTQSHNQDEVGSIASNALMLLHLKGISFRDAQLQNTFLKGVSLPGVDLTNANLKEADFSNANLVGGLLRKADLYRANFQKVDLTGADLTEANCQRTDFSFATLDRAIFRNAECSSYFRDTSVYDTDFRGARLAISDWGGGKTDVSSQTAAKRIAKSRGAIV